MKYITVGNCKKEIERMDPNINKDDEAYKVAVLLMYGSLSGKHHSKTLYAKTLYPMEFIKTVVKRLKDNGVWENGKTNASWDGESGGVEFWLHVTVGLGFIESVKQ